MAASLAKMLFFATASEAVRRKNGLTGTQMASEEEMRYYASQVDEDVPGYAVWAFVLGAAFVAHRVLAPDAKVTMQEPKKPTKSRGIAREWYVLAFCVFALLADSLELIDTTMLVMASLVTVAALVVRYMAAKRNEAAAMMKAKKLVD
eukprot:TRINITY_DN72900_c0_g1_i1.p2 TRINITY_DN72900_c0_g1~~TRINITY_DN72900_c0_g1_i1.p2  ORF type:complete len:148 (+),score=41.35 TRINITY_DN72900_c0_g1_i1:72-515(+)